MGLVSRNSRHFRSPNTVRSLFVSLVRPKLEYASVVWSASTDKAISAIESVQHIFLRLFMIESNLRMSPFNHDYTLALNFSNLNTLVSRRCINDLLFSYSIINSRMLCIDYFMLFRFNVPNRVIKLSLIIYIDLNRTSCAYSSSISRLMRSANDLLSSRDDFS